MNNINVDSITKLETPYEIKNTYNINYDDILFINNSRTIINNIIIGKNKKKMIIVGPCSIHNYEECIKYAEFIKKCIIDFPNIFIVIRLYFEKPRTVMGWKGYLYDPDLDNSNNIGKGLIETRKLLIEITKMRIPIATEFLDTIIPQYIDDLISFGCIGARTVESQLHRQLASGLSMAIGFKNRTDGNKEIAINAMLASKESHSFLGVNINGRASIVNTNGNKNTCIVLRGDCVNGVNFDEENITITENLLSSKKLNKGIIIDVSHDNTLENGKKNYKKQINNLESILNMWLKQKNNICGVMIESNLNEGKQSINDKPLQYGISITDGCIDTNSTYNVLNTINKDIDNM
jgi:3-deoxy-7-phosphoheptulonate synthase